IAITLPDTKVPNGVVQIALPGDEAGRISPGAIVAALAGRGLRRLLIEGGAETLARFIDAGLFDELHLMVAPIILGSGKTGLNLQPIAEVDEALKPAVQMMRFTDGDMLCVCALAPAVAAARPVVRLAASN
ncbi:MAG: dihydrofolate reductase family protein, partial [Pseudomonadota bacterium]